MAVYVFIQEYVWNELITTPWGMKEYDIKPAREHSPGTVDIFNHRPALQLQVNRCSPSEKRLHHHASPKSSPNETASRPFLPGWKIVSAEKMVEGQEYEDIIFLHWRVDLHEHCKRLR